MKVAQLAFSLSNRAGGFFEFQVGLYLALKRQGVDLALVTYSAKFRSASGVLNAAVSARKPVLASSGPGPLKTVVEKYQLGLFVEPDNFEEILRGASKLAPSFATGKCEFELQPEWERYERENSWAGNAFRVLSAFNFAAKR